MLIGSPVNRIVKRWPPSVGQLTSTSSFRQQLAERFTSNIFVFSSWYSLRYGGLFEWWNQMKHVYNSRFVEQMLRYRRYGREFCKYPTGHGQTTSHTQYVFTYLQQEFLLLPTKIKIDPVDYLTSSSSVSFSYTWFHKRCLEYIFLISSRIFLGKEERFKWLWSLIIIKYWRKYIYT